MAIDTAGRRIGLFLALTALFSSVFYGLIIGTGHAGGGHGAYATGLMWSPGLAALLTCRLSGLSLATLGWGWGRWRWQWLAYLIPLAYAALAYGAVWLFGWGSPDPAYVTWSRKVLGWSSAPDWLVVGGNVALVASTGLVAAMAHALGEEIGWRGFLTPRMTQVFGLRKGALLTGLIWTAWHLPILLFADYNSGAPAWYAMTCFGVMVVGMSVIMAWLRTVSGSLWTAALFHASHNLFIQSLFTPATAEHGGITRFAIDEFGFAVPLVVAVFAIVVWMLSKRRPEGPADQRINAAASSGVSKSNPVSA